MTPPDSPLTQRDVESLRTTLDKLDATIDRLRDEFVHKDVYLSDGRRIDDKLRGIEAGILTVSNTVEKIEERRAADRRLQLTTFVAPLILIVIQIYLTSRIGGS